MFNNLIPHISRHYLYSALKHDYENEVEIINTIARLQPGDIGEFLSSLAGDLDGLFYRFEADLGGYEEIKNKVIEALNTPLEADMEKFD